MRPGLVKIGNVRDGQVESVTHSPSLVSSNTYSTERRVRGREDDEYPSRHGFALVRRGWGGRQEPHRRPAWSPAHSPDEVGGAVGIIQPIATQKPRPSWSEKEIMPGLRVCVQRGHRWTAEKLDSGQVLLSPVHQQGYEAETGALMQDTDGFTREIDDPIPQPGGTRW